jgi:phosphoribosylglycinamide formyltransferase 2
VTDDAEAGPWLRALQDRQVALQEHGHDALSDPRVDLRLFGKPVSRPGRRRGVAIARADSTDEARELARFAASQVKVD